MCVLSEVLDFLFPFVAAAKANRGICAKIKRAERSDRMLDPSFWPPDAELDDLSKLHARSEDSRAKLEEKAKLSLVGISIAAALSTGTAVDISAKYLALAPNPVSIAFVCTLYVSLVYLVAAGIASLRLLGNVNRSYYFSINQLSSSKRDKKMILAKSIELTDLQNIRRNNIMFAALRCVVLGISILALGAILVGAFSIAGYKVFPLPNNGNP